LVNVGLRTFSNFWVYPPLGLMSLAAYVRTKFPVDIRILNQRLDNCGADEIAKRAKDFGADLVGLSALTTTACLLPDITAKVRAALPDAFVVLGGPHVSSVGALSLESVKADAAVSGEGERAFELLIGARFFGGDDLGAIPGLIWRASDGTVISNSGDPLIVENLDELPMPAYDLIDLPAYWYRRTIAPMLYRRYAPLITTRGCPFQCIWCHNIFGKKTRAHSPERIVEDLAFLEKTYGVRDFDVLDDTFNYSNQRVIDLCELLQTRDVKIRWSVPNGLRGDILTSEAIDAMADAGLFHCLFALESGSPRIQKYARKNLNIPRFLDNCERMAARRVFLHANCMLGFPTETEEELKQTIDVACASPCHTASFFIVTPYPGTPLYEQVGQTTPDKVAGIHFEMKNLSTVRVNLTDLPDEVLFSYQRKATRQFFLDPRRIARLVRDHPQRIALPCFAPLLAFRALQGVTGNH